MDIEHLIKITGGDKMEGEWYRYWFAQIRGISTKKKIRMEEQGILFSDLYNIEETGKALIEKNLITEEEKEKILASKKGKDWESAYWKMREKGVDIYTRKDEGFPKKINKLQGMPYALYVRGDLPKEDRLSVAIVGARNPTPYGEKMTLEFAECLGKAGVQIISGMAKGIDGIAHRGCLNAGGKTFAVLGSGVDICYPKEHKGLYQDLIEQGGVISEYADGTNPQPAFFPARNRIISGLSDVVLVMEAGEKSGSLITADMALEQGKDVYALPGPITSSVSKGCNRLIRQGAGILLSPEDFLDEMNISTEAKRFQNIKKEYKNKIMLESEENIVYSVLDLYPKHREEIIRLTGMEARRLAEVLVSLQIKGYIVEKARNYYIKR